MCRFAIVGLGDIYSSIRTAYDTHVATVAAYDEVSFADFVALCGKTFLESIHIVRQFFSVTRASVERRHF